jgi:hypothetical protein
MVFCRSVCRLTLARTISDCEGRVGYRQWRHPVTGWQPRSSTCSLLARARRQRLPAANHVIEVQMVFSYSLRSILLFANMDVFRYIHISEEYYGSEEVHFLRM